MLNIPEWSPKTTACANVTFWLFCLVIVATFRARCYCSKWMISGVPEKWKSRDLGTGQPLQPYPKLLLSRSVPAGQKCCWTWGGKGFKWGADCHSLNGSLPNRLWAGIIQFFWLTSWVSATLMENKMLIFFPKEDERFLIFSLLLNCQRSGKTSD